MYYESYDKTNLLDCETLTLYFGNVLFLASFVYIVCSLNIYDLILPIMLRDCLNGLNWDSVVCCEILQLFCLGRLPSRYRLVNEQGLHGHLRSVSQSREWSVAFRLLGKTNGLM